MNVYNANYILPERTYANAHIYDMILKEYVHRIAPGMIKRMKEQWKNTPEPMKCILDPKGRMQQTETALNQ
jgi:hypothetical protein